MVKLLNFYRTTICSNSESICNAILAISWIQTIANSVEYRLVHTLICEEAKTVVADNVTVINYSMLKNLSGTPIV